MDTLTAYPPPHPKPEWFSSELVIETTVDDSMGTPVQVQQHLSLDGPERVPPGKAPLARVMLRTCNGSLGTLGAWLGARGDESGVLGGLVMSLERDHATYESNAVRLMRVCERVLSAVADDASLSEAHPSARPVLDCVRRHRLQRVDLLSYDGVRLAVMESIAARLNAEPGPRYAVKLMDLRPTPGFMDTVPSLGA